MFSARASINVQYNSQSSSGQVALLVILQFGITGLEVLSLILETAYYVLLCITCLQGAHVGFCETSRIHPAASYFNHHKWCVFSSGWEVTQGLWGPSHLKWEQILSESIFLSDIQCTLKTVFFLSSPDFWSFHLNFSLDACQSILALLDVSSLAWMILLAY